MYLRSNLATISTMKEFGWRYFHFVDPSGPRINIVEHQTDIFGLESKPYMTMIAKEPKKEPLRFKGDPNLVWKNSTADGNGKFDFTFHNARFSGEITETIQHNSLNDIVLYQSETNRKSHWAVDIPYGKIIGELKTPTGEKQISGYLYQDRQWGNILIQEWVKNWTWTHLANNELFAVVFCINTTDGQKSWHSISGQQGKNILIKNDLKVPHIEKLSKSEHQDKQTFEAEIKIAGGLSASFSLSPKNIMRSRLNEIYSSFSASYLRWSVDGVTNCSDKSIHGVAEYMEIQKK